jgi:hypothetical protein
MTVSFTFLNFASKVEAYEQKPFRKKHIHTGILK